MDVPQFSQSRSLESVHETARSAPSEFAALTQTVATQAAIAEACAALLLPTETAARELQAVSAQVVAAAQQLVDTQAIAEAHTALLLPAQTAARELQAVSAQVVAAARQLVDTQAIAEAHTALLLLSSTDWVVDWTESSRMVPAGWSDTVASGAWPVAGQTIPVHVAERASAMVAALERLREMAHKTHVLGASLSWLRSLWNRRLSALVSSLTGPQRSRRLIEPWRSRFLRHSVYQHAPPSHGCSLATVAGSCVPVLEVLAT